MFVTFKYIVLCVFVADIHVVTSQCMDGWTVFGNSCYLFGREEGTFQDAHRFCEHFNSHLVNIETQTENAFLRSFLMELKAPKHWIGMTDVLFEDIWKFYPSEITMTYFAWGPGEPNGGKTTNCAAFQEHYGYNWVDDTCADTDHRAICEKPIETQAIVG